MIAFVQISCVMVKLSFKYGRVTMSPQLRQIVQNIDQLPPIDRWEILERLMGQFKQSSGMNISEANVENHSSILHIHSECLEPKFIPNSKQLIRIQKIAIGLRSSAEWLEDLRNRMRILNSKNLFKDVTCFSHGLSFQSIGG